LFLNENLLAPEDNSNGMSLFLKSFRVVPVDPLKLDIRHAQRTGGKAALEALSP